MNEGRSASEDVGSATQTDRLAPWAPEHSKVIEETGSLLGPDSN